MSNGPCTKCGGWCPTGFCYEQDNWDESMMFTPEQTRQHKIREAAPELYQAARANAAYYKWINGHYNGQDRLDMYATLKELGWVPTQEYYWSFMVRLTEKAVRKAEE
jgi:hypothetical protein